MVIKQIYIEIILINWIIIKKCSHYFLNYAWVIGHICSMEGQQNLQVFKIYLTKLNIMNKMLIINTGSGSERLAYSYSVPVMPHYIHSGDSVNFSIISLIGHFYLLLYRYFSAGDRWGSLYFLEKQLLKLRTHYNWEEQCDTMQFIICYTQ